MALPADYLLWRTVQAGRAAVPTTSSTTCIRPICHRPTAAAFRSVFTIEGNNVQDPPGRRHRRRLGVALLPQNPVTGRHRHATNWLLTEYPNAYLFGLITELAALQRNAEMAQLYKARRDEVFAEITQRYALTTGATARQVRTAEYF